MKEDAGTNLGAANLLGVLPSSRKIEGLLSVGESTQRFLGEARQAQRPQNPYASEGTGPETRPFA